MIVSAPAITEAQDSFGVCKQVNIPDYGDLYLTKLPGIGMPVALICTRKHMFITMDFTRKQPTSIQEISQHDWIEINTGECALKMDGLPIIIH